MYNDCFLVTLQLKFIYLYTVQTAARIIAFIAMQNFAKHALHDS
jgi:hypothetical protein